MTATGPALRHEPTGELVRRVINNVQALIDKQIALAKQELGEDVRQVAGAAKSLVIGIALLLLAGICFFNFLFFAVDTFLPGRWGWLAALILTLLFAIVGTVFAMKGRDQVKVQPLARTRETLKEDASWARSPLTPNGKSSPSETTSPQPSGS